MTRAVQPRVAHARNRLHAASAVAIALVAVAMLALPIGGLLPSTVTGAQHAAPPSVRLTAPVHAVIHAPVAALPRPAAPTPKIQEFNPPCYPVDTGVCVSIATPGEPEIIPTGSNRTSSIMPSANISLPLYVRSSDWLNKSGIGASPTWGPHAPIALNVTGVLWNGDQYYGRYDNSIWHANGHQWWTYVGDTSNKLYPHTYLVNFTAKGSNGGSNFFAGMQITWWIYLVYNTNNLSYRNHEGPHLTFTYAGAWPYSPYPGSPHFGGTSATSLDVNVTATPRVPNWNDSVHVTVNTTPADIQPYNATIGGAILDVVEVSHGNVLVNTSVPFPVTVTSGAVGNFTTTATIPAAYAQVEGAVVSYRIWILDTAKPADEIVTPWTNYTVGGNGSFSTGIFASDLIVSMAPASVLLDPFGYANLTPGQALSIRIDSRSPNVAILAAEIQYTVAYPILNETLAQSLYLTRVSSTTFLGAIPGLPVQSIVNFTISAWDFTNAVEVSGGFSYTVETFDQYVGPLSPDQSFFYVYVYDNGSGNWVQGASVQITGPAGVFNSFSQTTLGVAYANQSGQPYNPLLLQANATYNVTVTDPRFVPGGGASGSYGPVMVSVQALPVMTARQPLASTENYLVLQEGNQILFYLNATAPRPVASPSVAAGNPLGTVGVGAVAGLLGASLALIPLRAWWRQIKARRTAEEKRVTL